MFPQRKGIIFADGERHEEARTVASRFFSKHGLKSLTKTAAGGAASSSVAAIKEKLSRPMYFHHSSKIIVVFETTLGQFLQQICKEYA